jgi:hypothetical protein
MEHCRGYGPRPRNRNADQTHHQHHPPHGAPDASPGPAQALPDGVGVPIVSAVPVTLPVMMIMCPLYPGVLATTHMEKNWEPPPYA